MKISAKTEYACKALLELAQQWPGSTPVPIATIAAKQRIPIKFLTHILIQLKQLGYVESTQGKKGGYYLIKPPQQIQLDQVLRDMSEFKLSEVMPQSRSSQGNIFQQIWREADQVLMSYLGQINLDQLSKRDRDQVAYSI